MTSGSSFDAQFKTTAERQNSRDHMACGALVKLLANAYTPSAQNGDIATVSTELGGELPDPYQFWAGLQWVPAETDFPHEKTSDKFPMLR